MAKEPPQHQQEPASSESRDSREPQGKGKPIKEQLEGCRRFADEKGYVITTTYSDL